MELLGVLGGEKGGYILDQETLTYNDYINEGSLGRHETFTPRYGWLKKGYEAVDQDKNHFKAPDAIERLGAGKNMVSSIRFWSYALKILNTDGGHTQRTPLGDNCPNIWGKRLH